MSGFIICQLSNVLKAKYKSTSGLIVLLIIMVTKKQHIYIERFHYDLKVTPPRLSITVFVKEINISYRNISTNNND